MSTDLFHSEQEEPLIDRLKFAFKQTIVGGLAIGAFMNAPGVIESAIDNARDMVTIDFSDASPEAPIRNLP